MLQLQETGAAGADGSAVLGQSPRPEATATVGDGTSGTMVRPTTAADSPAPDGRARAVVAVATSAPTIAGATTGASAAPSAVRSRAVRLLREAAAVAAAAHQGADGAEGAGSSGEVAFAVEQAAADAFGAGRPRYYECVTRFALAIKVRDIHISAATIGTTYTL